MPDSAVESKPVSGPADDAPLLHSINVAKRFGRKTSHDFNNILAVIQGFASILQNRLQHDEANRGIAEQIEASAQEALKLTNWLSSFANNKMAELVMVDLNKVVEERVAALQAQGPPSVDLRAYLAPEPLWIMGDEVLLEQVCRELWSNAVEGMPDGGRVCFQCSREELARPPASGRTENGRSFFCRLRVSDSGTGMDQETQRQMFEPFFSTKNGKARGLGLTIVYDIVHQHQGFIQVSSGPEASTCLDLYFPAQARPVSPAAPDAKSTKLMVVDDEEMIRIMVQHMLKEQDCEVIGAASGEAALDACQDSNGEIKAVILDMTLPGMSGTEVFQKLREQNNQLKVIISTGDPHQQAVHDVMAQGAFGVLAKPFAAEHLIQVVRQALS